MRVLMLAAAVAAAPALGADLAVRAALSGAHAASRPQTDYFGLGAAISGGAQVGVASFADVGLDVAYVILSRAPMSPLSNPGSAFWLGATARVHLPFRGLVSPWLEVGAAFVRTGYINRPGLRAALGAYFLLGPVRLGPAAEVQQIFRVADEPTFPTADGTFFTFGVAVELPVLGATPATVVAENPTPPPLSPPPPPRPPPPPEPRRSEIPPGEPDADDDLVPDRVDLCPKVKGIPAEGGCPLYQEVRSTEQRIEIMQKILFATGKSTILQRSFKLLDEVVRAVKDRGEVCLVIGGHTDAVGDLLQNMSLSDGRAAAVREFLVQHGVPAERLTSKGFGPTQPIADNKTGDGREKNRRVEFVIVPCK